MAASLVFLFVALAQNTDANRFHPTVPSLNPTIPTSYRAHARVPVVAAISNHRMPINRSAPTVTAYNRIGGLTDPVVPTTRARFSSLHMNMGSGEGPLFDAEESNDNWKPNVTFVTPIGPFCSFQSQQKRTGPLADEMEFANAFAPAFAVELTRMQLEMQAGGEPDTAKIISLADSLTEASDKFSTALMRMQATTDFQVLERLKITEVFAQRKGESVDTVAVLMRWQADSMRAFAAGLPPPLPPPGIDLNRLNEEQQESEQQGYRSPVSSAASIRSSPFTGMEEAFKSETVRGEFQQLNRDHENIIKMGEQYGSFDPLGKIAFLDAVRAIEDRWDIFFMRFSLLGELNPEFKEQISDYLESMGLSPTEFRKVLREAHDIMRKDAEDERLR